MTDEARVVIGGVDTHASTHHAAVVDDLGRQLADRQFPTTTVGYRDLLGWLASFGMPAAVGVEGTGSYGAGLARYLTGAGLSVVEVDRPDRKTRRKVGKSDPVDAYAAAQAVVSGRATTTPKDHSGTVESIRALRLVRRSAIKARTQAMNQIHALVTTAPAHLREQLTALQRSRLAASCARLRPGPDLSSPLAATKAALRRLGRRIATLNEEITQADRELTALTTQVAAPLLQRMGVGPDVAGQLLVTAGDNPQRMRSEAAFAHLIGVAPIPASFGRRDRHRLNRGGDRAANHAVHTVVLSRLRHDPTTRAYAARRRAQGLADKDIKRCLKRYVARELYHVLISLDHDQNHTHPAKPDHRQAT